MSSLKGGTSGNRGVFNNIKEIRSQIVVSWGKKKQNTSFKYISVCLL